MADSGKVMWALLPAPSAPTNPRQPLAHRVGGHSLQPSKSALPQAYAETAKFPDLAQVRALPPCASILANKYYLMILSSSHFVSFHPFQIPIKSPSQNLDYQIIRQSFPHMGIFFIHPHFPKLNDLPPQNVPV